MKTFTLFLIAACQTIACKEDDRVFDSGAYIGSVSAIGNMNASRAAHTATMLPNGKVLIAGGLPGQASVEIYDPIANSFLFAPNMQEARHSHTAILLPESKVLIAGGFNQRGDYLASAELYDPATQKFQPAGRMREARSGHVAVLLDNGKVLLAGGVGTGWTFLASAELYDPQTGEFQSTGSMTTARESHSVTRLQDGRALITGGHKGRRAAITIYASTEIYDPVTGQFALSGNMTVKRHKHDAASLPGGKVLVCGGSDERDDEGAYTSAELYDPITGAFTATNPMNTSHYKHQGTSVLLTNGLVLISGGANTPEVYDPATQAFNLVEGSISTGLFTATVALPEGKAVITGGYGRNVSVSAQAWLYQQ